MSLPAYDSSPTGCAVGPFNFKLIPISAVLVPGWIIDPPIDSVSISTTDNSQIGAYQFRLVATDSVSGLSNQDVTFRVVLSLMKAK